MFDLNRSRKLMLGVFGLAVSFLLLACVQPDVRPANAPANNAPSNSVANTNTQAVPSPTEQKASSTVLTLPLLDALLSDEDFVAEAKSTLQLTDAELQKLRDVSRDAVLKLSDNPSVDQSRSTKAATDEAKKQLQQVLGADRASRLALLVDKHAGNEDLANAKPNQVPTDTRIVVNAPAYRMDVFNKGKLVQSYKIGIGYPEFPLPAGLRTARTIIFNPTWTPPDEAWVKGKVEPGKKIEAGDKLNPLGPIKIPIGSPSLIHGGKSPGRLGTFASHGCVGLTNPLVEDLALKLASVAGEKLTLADIKTYEKAKTETKELKLGSPVPVELRYETIVLENGALKIYRDVYEKGTNTEENLRRVLETFGVSLDDLQPQMKDQIMKGLEQMAVDAGGNPVAENDNNNANRDKSKRSKTAQANNNSGRVTRDIKGKKVVEFRIPELAGKGYPAPVGAKM